jgi:hypothetical protein
MADKKFLFFKKEKKRNAYLADLSVDASELEKEVHLLRKQEWDLFAEIGRQIYEQNKAAQIFPQQTEKLVEIQAKIATAEGRIRLQEREKRKKDALETGYTD